MTSARVDENTRGGIPYVITLASARAPMPVHPQLLHDLEAFSIFRSLARERGGDCFRLHVGYFASEALAREALEIVCHYYPTARVEFAPSRGLSSIDDTMNSGFSMVKSASARVVRRALATPSPPNSSSPELPRPAATSTTPHAAAVPPVRSPPAGAGETARRAPGAGTAAGVQGYVVQLEPLSTQMTTVESARLAIFDAYHVYRIRVNREGIVYHTLRLGFFQRIESAEAVAGHVRPHYPGARVAPVSAREQGSILNLVKRRSQVSLQSVQPIGGVARATPPALAIPAAPAAPAIPSAPAAAPPRAVVAAPPAPAPVVPPLIDTSADIHYEFNPAEL